MIFCRGLMAICFLMPFAPSVQAHGGGLDANGCHTEKKTGIYHCHGAKAPPPPRTASSFLGSSQVRSSTEYANCTEARAAGAAPVRAGDPGYSRKLDRDGDGVGCE